MSFLPACRLLLLGSICLLPACRPDAPDRRAVAAERGMVVSATGWASEIGAAVLREGGNAFDAAVAVQFALAVTFPRAGNIGGGGFAVYRLADGQAGALDFREKAGMAAHRDMYLDEAGEVVPDKSLLGHAAAGVPGSVDGMYRLHGRFGSLPMARLLAPSIALARGGMPVSASLAALLNEHRAALLAVNDSSAPNPFLENEAWQAGDTLRQPDLARTLERLRDLGRDDFYQGETAALLVAEMRRGGGIITLDDLRQYESVWRNPIVGEYRGCRVISMPPPSSGGVALLQLLRGIEPYPIGEWGHNSVRALHAMTEVERRVYADRATYLGDPDFHPVPVEMLLDPVYVRRRMSDIDLEAKTPSSAIKEGRVDVVESVETTHFSIVDAQGNAVSITTTLNGYFGCKVLVAGAGFFLNNEMDDFSVKPGVPNQFGLVGAEANAIQPGKRMLSSMTPTIVEKDGQLFLVLGSPGGSTIITSVFQTILNVVDHGMPLQRAVDAARAHHQWLPDRILLEPDSLPAAVGAGLRGLGHELEVRDVALGKIEAIMRLPDGTLLGAPDDLRGYDDRAVGH
jgi:gamma-glutamyltranspeptidase/glutathione hydrolase